MVYGELYSEFIKLFPENIDKLRSMADSASVDSSDGMHIMFGMVVMPFVMDLLTSADAQKLRIAFDFFEEMAEADDSKILEVLEFTILEDIVSHGKDVLGKCKTFMGTKTLERCAIIEKHMM